MFTELLEFVYAFLRTGIKPILVGMGYWVLCFLIVSFTQKLGVYGGTYGKYVYKESLIFSLGAMWLGFRASRSSGYYGWLGSVVYGLTPVISLTMLLLAFLYHCTLVPSEGCYVVVPIVIFILWPLPLFCIAGGLLGRKRPPV